MCYVKDRSETDERPFKDEYNYQHDYVYDQLPITEAKPNGT